MSDPEREFIKKLDEIILKASGDTLKKLQELDIKTQLQTTFYDAYVASHESHQKENALTKPKPFGKVNDNDLSWFK